PDELPDCSIPRLWGGFYSDTQSCQTLIYKKAFWFNRLDRDIGYENGCKPYSVRDVALLEGYG
ncbi:hypothetical protein, partial [Pseudomonas psychrophila]|uniref:hypothetical protein n=1 Tax=Pseudomonas psychrophila TaxID=122355 RepID=UPI001ED9219B